VITDMFQSRLDFAKTLVPTVKTVLVKPSMSGEETGDLIKQAAGMPLKIAMECTGVESSIRSVIYVSLFTSVAYPGVASVWR
jgi:L-iditol 2-dehydrogenase